jgi:ketosteroid isomerase-like protein
VTATNHLVMTFRDGKISHYQEFYDEQQARAALTSAD